MENTGISSRKLSATELKRKQLGSTSDRAFRQKRRMIGAQSLSSRFADPVSPAGDDQEIATFVTRKTLSGGNAQY